MQKIKYCIKQNRLRLFSFLSLLLILLKVGTVSVNAQSPSEWTPQDRIPGYDPLARAPFLIADQNRTVHAFNSTWVENERVIVYSQWTLDQGWTEPIDIILPQLKSEARLKGVFLDRDGVVHLLFFSGDDTESNIYYTRALLSEAGKAPAWSKPTVIGPQSRTPDEAALVGDGQNRLFVLYSGTGEGTGLYFTYSIDKGGTWSEPVPMFLTYTNDLFPFFVRMYIDRQNGVHALWNLNDPSGLSQEFHYAKLEAGQVDWNESIQFQAGGLNQPSIVEYENELLLIYHAGSDDGLTRYLQRSSDGGQTWSERIRIFPHLGSNGPASFVKDSNNTLHMFFGNRVGSSGVTIQGMWHSIWREGRWAGPKAIVSGPSVKDELGGEGFDPSFANAIVSQGNTILVAWSTDPQAGLNGAWYSYITLDSPELPVTPLPIPTVIPTLTPTSTAIPPLQTPTVSPKPELINQDHDGFTSSFISNPAFPLVVGLIPIILLISAVTFVYIFR